MSSTSTPYNIPALLKEIDTTGKSLGRDNQKARQQCLAAARSLCHALETPVESILRMNYAEVSFLTLPDHVSVLMHCIGHSKHTMLRYGLQLDWVCSKNWKMATQVALNLRRRLARTLNLRVSARTKIPHSTLFSTGHINIDSLD